jgi:hypothetical protein
MFMFDLRDIGWWYWLASSLSLWLALTINPAAFNVALLIGAFQLLHYIIAERSVTAFPVQIRIGYLCVLLTAVPEAYQWILWIPAIGTTLRVLTGYCIMARNLMLLPFNRQEKLTLHFIKTAYLTPPVQGNVLHGLPAYKQG